MNQIKVSAKRHLAKTISYRIISTAVGFLIMWWATGNITFGAAFGIAELLYKPIQYYIHERVWYRWIKFGINDKPKKPRPIKVEEPEVEKPKDTVKRLNYTRR
jgi:uncharacterized membrane protein